MDNDKKFLFLHTFFLEKAAGSANLIDLLKTVPVTRIDPEFREVLDLGEDVKDWATNRRLLFHVFEARDMSDLDMISVEVGYVIKDEFNSKQIIFALLQFLGGEGSDYLKIPEGEEEIKIVLGYGQISGTWYRLIIEHELEEGRLEQIHLHASPAWEKPKKPFLFFHIVQV